MMTTLTFDPSVDLRDNLIIGEVLLEKAGKLLERINSALFVAIRQESLEKDVDYQFDKVMSSVNCQLKKSEKGALLALREVKSLNLTLVQCINKEDNRTLNDISSLSSFCSVLITAINLVLMQMKATQKNLVSSGINSASIRECTEILHRLEKICLDICGQLEEVSMNADIYEALGEPALTKSSDSELSALLG